MDIARERENWRLAFDLIKGKGAAVAAWLAVNDPFQDAVPCFHRRDWDDGESCHCAAGYGCRYCRKATQASYLS